MYPSVKEVVPRDDFLDMKPILDFGVFRRIKDYETFRRVRVAFDTIEWDCGVDLDPEFIYAKCKAHVPA